jgi:hypothetical protein
MIPNVLDMEKAMSEAASVEDAMQILKNQFTKNPQTTTTTRDIIEVDYDEEIKTRLVTEAPFLRFLEEKGRIDSSDSAIIGWRNKSNKNFTQIIPETGPVPAYGGKDWTVDKEVMRTFIYPVAVSMMSQMGNSAVDLLDDDIQDGFADISARKDKEFLLGVNNAANPHTFNGIDAKAESTDDKAGRQITLEDVENMVDKVIAKGSTPDCIVTTARVNRQIVREQNEKQRFVNQTEFITGHETFAMMTPVGVIPIIVDRNLATFDINNNVQPNSRDKLFVVDSKAVAGKSLMDITEFPLALTRPVHDSMLLTFTTFGISAPQKLGVISGIGNTVATESK